MGTSLFADKWMMMMASPAQGIDLMPVDIFLFLKKEKNYIFNGAIKYQIIALQHTIMSHAS